MSSFDDFLRERRIFDIYDSFSKEEKIDLIKLYEERARAPSGKSRHTFSLISLYSDINKTNIS